MNPYIVGVEQVLLRKNEHLKRIINALVERLGGTVDLSSEDIAATETRYLAWIESDGDVTLTIV